MAERITEFGQFIIQPKNSKSSCKVFIAEKESEKELGVLFGIIEIESPQSKANIQILEKISEEIQDIYFKTAAANIKSRPNSPLNFEDTFEQSLHKINQIFFEISNQLFLSSVSFEPKIRTPGKVSAALALMQNNNLYLTQSGRIFSFLIYQIKPNEYKIIDILENAADQGIKQTSKHAPFFSNVIKGEIEPGSSLVFCNESVLDYLSIDKLKKTVAGRHPEEASTLIKNLLGEIESSGSFAAILVRPQPEIKEPPFSPAVQTPESEKILPLESMHKLLDTESKTEKLLTPSFKLGFKKPFLSLLTNLKFLKPKEGKKFKNIAVKIIKLIIYYPLVFFWKILFFFLRIFYKTFLLIFYFIFKQKEKSKKASQEISQELKLPFQKFANWFSALPRLSKIFFLVALIFIFLFAQSIFFLNEKYKNEIAIEEYNASVITIQNKKNEAEASLIYNDEEGARKKLLEAKDLAEKLPQNSQRKKETKDNLLKEIQVLLVKLQHISDIDNPILIADLTNQNSQIEPRGLFAAKNYLYTFDSKSNLIYKINSENKETEIIDSAVPTSSHLELGVQKDKNYLLLYYLGENPSTMLGSGFLEFDLENQTSKKIDIILEDNEKEFKDIDLYNQRVYLLDDKNNQIWKHLPTLSGYARGTPWLKEKIDITSASSMAIDGEIYLIKTNGEILRLAGGYRENFEAKIDPALSSPTKIWTSLETKYIYILEPQTNRLIVLDKNGKIKIQYRSSQFNNLKDFIVLEKEKKIYLLCGSKIYGIAVTHL